MTARAHSFTLAHVLGLSAIFGGAITGAQVQNDAPKASAPDEAQRDYLSGNGLLNRGLNELAATEYRRFLAEHADHAKAPLARYGLAVALFRMGKMPEAAEQLTQLRSIKGFEFAAEVATMTGQCELAAGDFAEAGKLFAEVADGRKEHELADDAAAGLVEALYRDQKYKDAVQRADRFAQDWPQSPAGERVEFFAALAEMHAGEFAAAATRLSAFLKAYPRSDWADQATLRLAQCQQRSGATDQAIAQYESVLQRKDSANTADALYALGTLHYQEKQYEAAEKALSKLLETYPDSPLRAKAQFQRAQVYFAVEKFDAARQAFEASAELDPQIADRSQFWAAKCSLKQENFGDAAERLAKGVKKFPESTLLPEMLYDRGVALYRAEKPDQSVKVLDQFVSRYSDHPLAAGATHLLAAITHRAGKYDESGKWCAEFRSKFATDPAAPAVEFLQAENEFLAGKYQPAAEGYQGFLGRNAKSEFADQARYRLAISLYRLDRMAEAEPLLSASAELAEKNAAFRPAILALGDLQFERGEWKNAELNLSKYLASAEEPDELALMKLAYARQQQGRLDEALADYDRLLAKFPAGKNRVQAEFERGQVLVGLKRTDDAAAAFERVVAAKDERFTAHALNHLGAIAMQKGDAARAAELYAQAGKLSDGKPNADLAFQEAQAHIAARDFAAAEKALQRFLKAAPDHDKAAQAAAQLAVSMSRQDRYVDALKAIDRAEGDANKLDAALRASLQYERAWCLRALGKDDAAADAYRQLLATAPGGDLELHAALELGEIEAGGKRWESAAAVLSKLSEKLQSADGAARSDLQEKCNYRLAVCEFELGNLKATAERMESLLAEFPKSTFAPSALFYAGEANFKLGQYEKAVAHFERLTKQFASDALAESGLLRLGESLSVLHRWAASERAYEEYLRRNAESGAWYQARFGLGWAKENQKRYDDARADYEKVVARHQGPTAARAQFQIGQCLFAAGEYEDAVRELLKVDILYAYPEWSAAALYEAGRCFAKLGKNTEARSHFEQVATKYKESEWAVLASRQLAEPGTAAHVPGH